jgi:hypothetical protein
MKDQLVPGGQLSWMIRNGIGLLLLTVVLLIGLSFFIHYPVPAPGSAGKATRGAAIPIDIEERTLGHRLFSPFLTLFRRR